MKAILTSLLLSLLLNTSFAQVISYGDFKEIIPFIQKEDFKGAFEKTKKLLNSTENDSSDLRGIITYMNIFSSAGMVSSDQMSYKDFIKNANKYVGQYVVMSAHPFIDSLANGYNSLQFIRTDSGTLQGMTISSNNTKTSILCFEYFEFAEEVNPDDFTGKIVRCGGILQSFEPNPNKSKIWICRLRVSNAFARVTTPK